MQTTHQQSPHPDDDDDDSDMARAARREMDDARQRLAHAAERVREEARNAGSTITTLILDELDRRAADVGTQFRSVADRLRQKEGDVQGDATEAMSTQAADLIEEVSDRLQSQSVRDMSQRLGQFGRDNPALFLMGCLLTGAVAGRMIVASDPAQGQGSTRQSTGGHRGSDQGNRAARQTGAYQSSSDGRSCGAGAGQGTGLDRGDFGAGRSSSGTTWSGAGSSDLGNTATEGSGSSNVGSGTGPDASDAMDKGRSGSGIHD